MSNGGNRLRGLAIRTGKVIHPGNRVGVRTRKGQGPRLARRAEWGGAEATVGARSSLFAGVGAQETNGAMYAGRCQSRHRPAIPP